MQRKSEKRVLVSNSGEPRLRAAVRELAASFLGALILPIKFADPASGEVFQLGHLGAALGFPSSTV